MSPCAMSGISSEKSMLQVELIPAKYYVEVLTPNTSHYMRIRLDIKMSFLTAGWNKNV